MKDTFILQIFRNECSLALLIPYNYQHNDEHTILDYLLFVGPSQH